MSVDVKKAREFVYNNGTLFEQTLYGWLFEEVDTSTLLGTIRAYKNPDGGYGHAFEHDIKAPMSHPLALEYLLQLMVRFQIPTDDLLVGTAAWVEQNQSADGSLSNPSELKNYPMAVWWQETGGQVKPTSIVGHLTTLGAVTREVVARTRVWVVDNLSIEAIAENEWLFMAYHAHDYFMNVENFPDLEDYRAATVENIIRCFTQADKKQWYTLFLFAYSPDAPAAKVIPSQLLMPALEHLEQSQQDDGCWHDEHGLAHWYPITTIGNLWTLKQFGRLEIGKK